MRVPDAEVGVGVFVSAGIERVGADEGDDADE